MDIPGNRRCMDYNDQGSSYISCQSSGCYHFQRQLYGYANYDVLSNNADKEYKLR